MKTFQRILAIALALIMSLSVLGTVAFADEGETVTTTATIDTGKTGSLTIHKFENDAKGLNGDGTEIKDTSSFGDPLDGVTFTLYQVMSADDTIAYYDGTYTESVTVNSFLSGGAIDSSKVIGEAKTAKTADGGTATFTDLAVGMYVVVETAYPDKVTKPADPFLVSIPMTNPGNESEWMYDVHVYPKNSTAEGTVTIVKKGESGTLEGVEFTLAKQNGNSWDPVAINETTTFVTNSNGEIIFSNLAFGTYRVTETKTADGYILDGRAVEFTIDEDGDITLVGNAPATVKGTPSDAGLTIEITNEKPDITKEVTTDIYAAGVGSTVKYELTVEVPQNIGVLSTFKVTDDPTNVQVDEGSIVVKCGNNELTEETDYTIAENTENANGFVINFVCAEITDCAGQSLTITYDATVLASAAKTNNAPNTATLTYTDVINADGTEGGTDDDDDNEIVYNFRIDITKWLDASDETNGSKAEGVQFKLYDADGNVVKATLTDGIYVVDANGSETLTTDADGKVIISGLAKGTYTLKETKTVDGYNLLSGSITIELDETKEITKDLSYEETIVNKQGFKLPQTGGIGTLMFIIIGGVLIAGGICLITVPNKKRSV